MRPWLAPPTLGLLTLLAATAGEAAPLKLVNVSFPAVNCKFDTDCTIYVSDLAAHFVVGPSSGDAFLQSRTWPVGQAGTAGAGRYAYLYRIDLRQLAGLTALPCVNQMRVGFGPVVPLDYDGDGTPDDVFVGTGGGLGTVAPTSADKVGDTITFHFSPGVCAGSSPGNGQSSFFFGLASSNAPAVTTATLADTLGDSVTLEARAPQLAATATLLPGSVWYMIYGLIGLALLALGYFFGRRQRTVSPGTAPPRAG
jgi:hypothetical protein